MSAFKEIIDCYLRYALIRGCKFTNSKQLIETVVYKAFIGVFYATKQLGNDGYLPFAVDIIVDAAGEDLAKKSSRIQDNEVFIKKCPQIDVVKAINNLDNFARLLLVLHYIEKISIERLAGIFVRPVDEIKFRLGRAQREFIENLAGFLPEGSMLLAEDIDKWLGLLGDCFNQADVDRIKKVILVRLIGQE